MDKKKVSAIAVPQALLKRATVAYVKMTDKGVTQAELVKRGLLLIIEKSKAANK
jgi:hypothetical protein